MRLILLFLSLFSFQLSYAAESKAISPNESIIVTADQVIEGDYFAIGHSVEISGTVKGDVFVLATQVFIDGQVEGDVLVAGGNIEITGDVLHNIRVIGGQVMISGKVGRNATIVAGNAQIGSSTIIQGNLVCTAGNVNLAATVNQDATIAASNLRISNTIRQNLEAYVGTLHLTSRASVGGNLTYTSRAPIWIESGAKIGGKIDHQTSLVSNIFQGSWIHSFLIGSKVAASLMNFIYTLVVGCILLYIFPHNVEIALSALSEKPLTALIYGAAVLILLPLACLILLMTILGVPFALTLIALNLIGFYTAKVYPVLWVSNHFCSRIKLKPNKIPTFALGLVVYFILAAIPYFGFFVSLAALLFGIGAALLAQTKKKALHLWR